MGLSRSESSFVAVLGWYFTPGYFSCEHESQSQLTRLCGWVGLAIHPSFTCPLLVRLLNPREPVSFHDASNIPFLRSHDSQLAGVTASDWRFTHIPARFPD